MVIQALHYEEKNPQADLDEFWVNTERYLKDKELKGVFEELKRMRKPRRQK